MYLHLDLFNSNDTPLLSIPYTDFDLATLNAIEHISSNLPLNSKEWYPLAKLY